jgi:hypothetical protein
MGNPTGIYGHPSFFFNRDLSFPPFLSLHSLMLYRITTIGYSCNHRVDVVSYETLLPFFRPFLLQLLPSPNNNTLNRPLFINYHQTQMRHWLPFVVAWLDVLRIVIQLVASFLCTDWNNFPSFWFWECVGVSFSVLAGRHPILEFQLQYQKEKNGSVSTFEA